VRSGLAAKPGEPDTVRRPAAPEPVSAEKPQRGFSMVAVSVIGGVLAVAAVVLGVVLMSSHGGGKLPPDPAPSGPVATDLAGGGSDIVYPKVTASYDATTQKATFTWTPASGSGVIQEYFYSVGDGKQPAGAGKTSVTVPATDPQHTCITVFVLLTNGQDQSNGEQTCAQ
jgi:hypothetical protein